MITLVPLSGFLGSGKTTTLISAAVAMQRTGRRVAVITNDAGPHALVDTELARAGLGEVAQIAGGCLCHRQEELAARVAELVESGHADTVLVESSGTCPGPRPALAALRRRLGDRVALAPPTVVVDPLRLEALARVADRCGREYELGYLFGRQLAAGELLAVNKTDLIGAERTAKLEASLAADHPHATVLPYSATTGAGIGELVRAWSGRAASAEHDSEHELDPLRYAEAEAKLAWLNQAIDIEAAGETFDALVWGRTVLRFLSEWSASAGYLLGHAKVAVRTRAGLAKLSVTEAGGQPRADRTAARPVERAAATVNVRVACPTAALDGILPAAVRAADVFSNTRSHAAPSAAFRAAQPPPNLAAVRSGAAAPLRTTVH